MAKELDSKFWAKYFKVYDVLNMVIPYQDLLNTIVKEADIKKGDVVLDAGCGTGNLSMKLKKAGAKVFGVDYCIEALTIYRQKDPKAEMFVHDLTKPLPFSDNYFDALVCNNVLYAIDKKYRQQIINEFYRVLKSGGRVVLSNAQKGNRPIEIYKDTVRMQKKQFGMTETVRVVLKMVIPTIKILIFNNMIVKANNSGKFSFMANNDQVLLLSKGKFKVISETMPVYSGQAILNSGKK